MVRPLGGRGGGTVQRPDHLGKRRFLNLLLFWFPIDNNRYFTTLRPNHIFCYRVGSGFGFSQGSDPETAELSRDPQPLRRDTLPRQTFTVKKNIAIKQDY